MASVSEFLIERLENAGIRHVFGVPGDYILHFFGKLIESKKIEVINNADECGSGFAADGYARLNGMGCVAVTYNVGALKIANAIAGAYAERSPVIVISGAPGVSEANDPPMHHMVGNKECQRDVFKKITCAQAVLDNPQTAGYEIDRAFEALKRYKQPIYIELPRDMATKPIQYDVYTVGTPKGPETDFENLEDSLREVASWLFGSKNPVIMAGVEIARYQLGKDLIRFAERHNIPVVCTLLSKSVVNEMHPLYAGVYAGNNSSEDFVKEMVDGSDCLLVLGEVITEATTGYRYSKVYQKRDMVTCTADTLKIRNHQFPGVPLLDFCNALFKIELPKREMPKLPEKKQKTAFIPSDKKLTTVRMFEKINSLLDENTIIIADTGDSLLGASDLMTVHHRDSFLGPAFYLSMGFAIPAAIGVKFAKPKMRPIVIVGDGAFQMSLAEISTMIRWKQNPIIFVLNNHGYTTERLILDGKFNNILDWNYHLVTQLMGGGQGFKVETEAQLVEAVEKAVKSDGVSVINCLVDSNDSSPALRRIGEALSKKLK